VHCHCVKVCSRH